MTDETKDTEQQGDNIIVDVQTGERSDDQQAQSFDIVEHEEGKKYIAADKAEEYRQHKAEELAAMQTEIDNTLAAIAEIDRINAVEERQQIMADFVAENGDDYDMTAVTDFDNEAEFNEMMEYLRYINIASRQNPSAGFGPSLESRGQSPQQWQYEQGAAAARQIYEKRGRR